MTMDSLENDAPARFGTRQWLVVVLLCGTQFMLALDFSILSVSLPKIGDDLHFQVKDLQWIITAFALPSGGLLLLFGRAADLYGRRRWYLAGMALFITSSLVGGLSVSPGMLLAARAGQGVASAMLTPAAMSLLTTSFPEGKLRARALGINGTLLSLGFLIGVVLGGVITELTSWRSTLFINVPFGLLALVGATILIRESRNLETPRLDVAGAITVTGGLLLLIFGVTSGERAGWGDPVTGSTIVAGAVLLIMFPLIESRIAAPLIDLRILRRRTVIWGNLTGMVTFSMVTGVVFLLTLYMQQVRGLSPLDTGFSFAALGCMAVIGGLFAARVIARLGVQMTLVLGLLLQAVSTAALLGIRTDGGLAILLVATGVVGLGHVFAVVGYMVIGTSGVADEEQGMATSLTYTAQQLGLTIGTPVLSTIAATRLGAGPTAARTVDGVHLGVLVDVVIVAVAVVIALVLLRPRSAPAAAPVVARPVGDDVDCRGFPVSKRQAASASSDRV
ncbi:MFS transporter [Frankia sp. QA3]|uniref:MFS transporter n=1 Tax=Frankia sp. QA3 TaxID=710111 RepID=UPI000269C197|nr:MFS transporter [Frankia sp. QA3]EIV92573.1 arabinose efflux permease family protein [Frankia sp. QA3]